MATVKSRRQPGRKKLSSPYYPNDIWIAWSTPNQRWFLLQGKSVRDSIILDRFETRAEAASAAERLTGGGGGSRRDPRRTIRGMHSGFTSRVFEAAYKAALFRLRHNDKAADRAEDQLERLLREARDSESAPVWWKNDVRAAAERGREAGKQHFDAFGAGARKNANPFRPMRKNRVIGRATRVEAAVARKSKYKRDPSSKVTNLAEFREKKRAANVSRETQDYERREVESFQRQLREVEKLPLSERKENAQRFAEDLHRDPELIAERVGWLLNGSYGRGAYTKAMQMARSPRMNQGAWLVQTTAALEWRVPPRMTAQTWHTLSAAQRSNLERLVQREIRDALSEE